MAERIPIPAFEDVFKGGLGVLIGLITAGVVQVPKALANLLFGRVGAAGSAVVDGLLTTWAIYDLATKPEKDAFWKGAEGAFAFAEVISTLINIYNALKG